MHFTLKLITQAEVPVEKDTVKAAQQDASNTVGTQSVISSRQSDIICQIYKRKAFICQFNESFICHTEIPRQ